MYWDYLGSNPESLYQVMRLFSDLGTPYGFRHMDAWTGHTYRCVIPLCSASMRANLEGGFAHQLGEARRDVVLREVVRADDARNSELYKRRR